MNTGWKLFGNKLYKSIGVREMYEYSKGLRSTCSFNKQYFVKLFDDKELPSTCPDL